jgi:broad specificity phosphatase PhoE
MKKIFLIRHAESEGNVGGYFEESHNIPLTEVGKRQAEDLVEIVMDKELPDRIIYSKFIRTKETADPLLKKLEEQGHKYEVHMWLDAHEFEPHDNKKTLGMSLEERKNFYMSYWEKSDPFSRETENSESFQELVDRLLSLLKKMQGIPDGINLVFTHGIIIKMFLFLGQNFSLFAKSEDGQIDYKKIMEMFKGFNFSFKTKNAGVYDVTELVEKYSENMI